MTTIHNPTTWSDFDWLEFEAFVSKVENEGFTYAAEEYPPHFESPELQALAGDLSTLRTLYLENERKVDDWWATVGGERACELQHDHIDEADQRREDARLYRVGAALEALIVAAEDRELPDPRAVVLAMREIEVRLKGLLEGITGP